MKPEWCDEKTWKKAADIFDEFAYATEVHLGAEISDLDRATKYDTELIACALLTARQEQQAEIDRLNKVIERIQQTMSSQAEQWTRSMDTARQEGRKEAFEEAAQLCEQNVETVGARNKRRLVPFDDSTQGMHSGQTYAAAIRARSNEVK